LVSADNRPIVRHRLSSN